MGFVGDVMEKVQGIHLYYIIGLFIFITLFIVMLTRTFLMPKAEIIDIKTSILESDNSEIRDSN